MNKTLSADGTAIAYDRVGEGPPVVLVDGALCSRSFGPMPELAARLAQRFTVFHYDRRGRNDSGDSPSFSVRREVEDLGAVMKEAGGPARVLGMSSGAAIALEGAASGLPILRLALYEPPYVADGDGDGARHAGHQAHLAALIAAGKRGDAVSYFMTRMVGMPAAFAALFRILPMWSRLKAVAHTLPYDAAVMGDFSVPVRRASTVRVPTLVAGGEKSPKPLREAVQRLAQAVPGAELRQLAGQNHNVSLKVLAPVLTEFFAR